jgi:hypothetical protein
MNKIIRWIPIIGIAWILYPIGEKDFIEWATHIQLSNNTIFASVFQGIIIASIIILTLF